MSDLPCWQMCRSCSIGSCEVKRHSGSLGSTRFYSVSLGFTLFHSVSLGSLGFTQVLYSSLCFTRFHLGSFQVHLGSLGFTWHLTYKKIHESPQTNISLITLNFFQRILARNGKSRPWSPVLLGRSHWFLDYPLNKGKPNNKVYLQTNLMVVLSV